MGADEAGEVEAIVIAVLLPVEAGAALLAGRDDGHLARQLPVGQLFETGPFLLPVDLIPLGLSGGTAGQYQQAGEGEDTQEQGRAPDKRFATV